MCVSFSRASFPLFCREPKTSRVLHSEFGNLSIFSLSSEMQYSRRTATKHTKVLCTTNQQAKHEPSPSNPRKIIILISKFNIRCNCLTSFFKTLSNPKNCNRPIGFNALKRSNRDREEQLDRWEQRIRLTNLVINRSDYGRFLVQRELKSFSLSLAVGFFLWFVCWSF